MTQTALPDESVKVPDCDCPFKYHGPRLHRPRCPRMAAIFLKWHGPEAKERYLRGEHA